MMNLDFSSVPSREPLEEGKYILTIAEAEEKISSTGNPMISITYDVNSTFDGVEVPGQRKLWDNYSLVEKALFKIKELLEALGYDTSELVTMDVTDMVGGQVVAQVIQETYNGEIRNRIKKVYPLS